MLGGLLITANAELANDWLSAERHWRRQRAVDMLLALRGVKTLPLACGRRARSALQIARNWERIPALRGLYGAEGHRSSTRNRQMQNGFRHDQLLRRRAQAYRTFSARCACSRWGRVYGVESLIGYRAHEPAPSGDRCSLQIDERLCASLLA